MFTTTVQFASDRGDLVSSDVIQAVQNWAQTTPNAALTVGSNLAAVLQVCSPSCADGEGESMSDVMSSLVALFFAGLVVGLLLVAIPFTIVW